MPLPIVLRPPSPLTDDELIAFSRRNKPYRIEKNTNGEITITTPVGGQGSIWEAFIVTELSYWARDMQSGQVFGSAGGFNLPDGSTLSPDAAWVANSRWSKLDIEQKAKYPPLCPDFVVEIRSKTDSMRVLRTKMEVWIANGAQLAWMIDPYAATLTIYRPGREPEVKEKPDFVEAEAPVAGFRLTTSKLWAETE